MICLGKFWILFISFTNLGALCLYFYDTSPSGHILYCWLSYHLFTNLKIITLSKNEVFMVVVFCYQNSLSWALWGLSTFWWQLQSAGFSSRNSLKWLTKTFQIKLSRLTKLSRLNFTDWLHPGALFSGFQHPESPGISWAAQVWYLLLSWRSTKDYKITNHLCASYISATSSPLRQ